MLVTSGRGQNVDPRSSGCISPGMLKLTSEFFSGSSALLSRCLFFHIAWLRIRRINLLRRYLVQLLRVDHLSWILSWEQLKYFIGSNRCHLGIYSVNRHTFECLLCARRWVCLAESVLSSDFVPENAKFPVEASVAYHLHEWFIQTPLQKSLVYILDVTQMINFSSILAFLYFSSPISKGHEFLMLKK